MRVESRTCTRLSGPKLWRIRKRTLGTAWPEALRCGTEREDEGRGASSALQTVLSALAGVRRDVGVVDHSTLSADAVGRMLQGKLSSEDGGT
jgi:hypothetical protein